MKKIYYYAVFIFFISSWCFGQRMYFSYDAAGNQILREYRVGPDDTGAPNNRSEQTDETVKFHPEDDFSYYPNPVKDYLQLQWQPVNRYIKEMVVYNLNGQALQKKTFGEQDREGSLYLGDYTKGTYMLHIIYSDDDVATVKILKN
jgi:hypothetical protein